MTIPRDDDTTQTVENTDDPTTAAPPRISVFANARRTKPVDELTLAEALGRIRDGTYEPLITELRQILTTQGQEAYTKAKSELPAFTFGGTFTTRKNTNLIAHSGIVHLDLDHLDDVAATRQRLSADRYVAYCFLSPSGTGLKLGALVDPVPDDAAYKRAWQQVADYVAQRYRIDYDKSGKDVARLCFVSWDADCYMALDAPRFPVKNPGDLSAERALKTAVEMIETSAPGHLHQARLDASNLLGGYVGGGFLTYDMAYAALEAAVRRHTDDFERSMKTIADGLAYGQTRPFSLSQLEAEQAAWAARRATNGHAPQADVDASNQASTSNDVLPPYILRHDALYYRKPGTTDDQRLCNFMAWITEERSEDDGAELKRIVAMEATVQPGKPFPDIAIPMAEFYNLAGLLKQLGTEAIVSPGLMVKDRIRHAIQLYSQRRGYAHRRVFTHLGWRQIDGAWTYLHAGGSIPPKVEVRVGEELARYRLPEVTSAKVAVRASLRLLECAPRRITVPLVAAAYLAPLAEVLKPDTTIWLEGRSGARKSSLAALILCHFGRFDRAHPPDSWESTANALKYLAFLAKDVLLWIDDYAPRPRAMDMYDQERKAQRLIRAQGNLSGRGRLRADMTLRPVYYPRGVLLSTGELHPTGTSTFARLLQLEVGPDDVDLTALTASQDGAPLLAEAMAAYITWLQPRLDALTPELKSRWVEHRAAALPHLTHHTRQPEVYAHLMVAWELFLSFAADVGALREDERQEQRTIGEADLIEAINGQRLDAEAEDPADRFCAQLREAFLQESAYLEDARGGPPPQPGQWGWACDTIHDAYGGTHDEWKPARQAVFLGWIDDDFVYLLPESTYRLVFERFQRAGTLLLPQTALWKLLADRSHLRRGADRYAIKKRIGANTHWILQLARACVEPRDVSEDGNTGNIGNNSS